MVSEKCEVGCVICLPTFRGRSIYVLQSGTVDDAWRFQQNFREDVVSVMFYNRRTDLFSKSFNKQNQLRHCSGLKDNLFYLTRIQLITTSPFRRY